MTELEQKEIRSYIEELPDDFWTTWVLLTADILEFYAEVKPDENIESGMSFIIKLLITPIAEYSIDFFRCAFKTYIESHSGKFKRLASFPDHYTRTDKVLTKKEDAELSFYFAVIHCISAKNNKDNNFTYNIKRANFLHGHAIGLSGIKSSWIPTYHKELKTHDLGGQVLKNKADLAKNRLFALYRNRFHDESLSKREKTSKAAFARYIVRNPNLIQDENGYPIEKNGEPWYTAENTVTGKLAEFDKEHSKG